MLFSSSVFLPFLLLTFLLWLPAGRTGRKLVLIASSLLFYGAWDPRFLALLGAGLPRAGVILSPRGG